jgi:hypothetical protein
LRVRRTRQRCGIRIGPASQEVRVYIPNLGSVFLVSTCFHFIPSFAASFDAGLPVLNVELLPQFTGNLTKDLLLPVSMSRPSNYQGFYIVYNISVDLKMSIIDETRVVSLKILYGTTKFRLFHHQGFSWKIVRF